ncbi:NAD(P)-dependent alcohol dehydrogenase [Pelagicoccus mobilis]|uniref:NAD(P)-dependent alcohol dehydrogenase n=1 Tax=Pelagicoccus mobilis TaxID=415221 RepID=A0A934RXI4_9BACT|nr:NAD(P)-dependent alcohol dehydrogenase [Pelagicoccus mobilis]MBK1878597.1 NAD(P)-dependent alcohol dehydrogenase [Pelagicoccus mobilis]
MKAIVLKKYGSPSDLALEEHPTPTPKPDEVLVKIVATAVNDWDWCLTRAKPFYIRLLCGFFSPKVRIPGAEISGVVEKRGSEVTTLAEGDAVYADISECGFGGFAEYVCVPASTVSKKPESISHFQAAALPHAAMLAIQGLFDSGELQPGQSLLANGAGGGVGTLAVQLAKAHGVDDVTGVDSADKAASMKEQGYNKTIDYQAEDFTRNGGQYHLILDTKTNRFPLSYLRALHPGGRYVTVGGRTRHLLLTFLVAPLIHLFTKKRIRIVGIQTNRDLDQVSELCASGKLTPLVEGPFPLKEAPRLVQRFGEGRHQGKIILTTQTP